MRVAEGLINFFGATSMEEVDRHVIRKYEISQRLGKGAYGIVFRGVDKRTGETVAIKKCFDAFQNATDAQRTFREISYLQALNHENIITIKNVLKAENDRDLYVITDFMESDLHIVIKSNIPLLVVHKQYIIYQVLRALKYMHSAGVISRDIKPSNILLNSDCSVKICDLGLARSVLVTSSKLSDSSATVATLDASNVVMTDYTATRWYRAPEILLGSQGYSFAVDLFAAGCVLGEMLHGRPLFAGTSTLNQLEKLLDVLGFPDDPDLHSINSPYAKTILDTLKVGPASGSPVQHVINKLRMKISDAPPEALDLLANLLLFNPYKRLSAETALRHIFLRQFHDPKEEPVHPAPPVSIALDDNIKLTVDDYRGRIYESIRQRRRDNKRG